MFQLYPDTAAVAPPLPTETAGMFQRLRSEFAEPSTDMVAVLEAVAVAELKENTTSVEAIAVAKGMEENMSVVEAMEEDMTVEAMEEDMTVEARGHYMYTIAAVLVGEESVVAVAAVAMENGEGLKAAAGMMAHW